MALGTSDRAVVVPEDDRRVYQQIAQLLSAPTARLIGESGEGVDVPRPMQRMLRTFAQILAEDKVAVITSASKDLTTQQAADLLGISRPSLIRLLEDERMIPFAWVGKHRRIRFADLQVYRERLYQQQRRAMTELTRLGEAMGGYDDPGDPPAVDESA
jgi:excisionase family DNA binding protein